MQNLLKEAPRHLRQIPMFLLLLFLLFVPDEAFAQFRSKGPKNPQRYNSWVQKNHGYNGGKLNSGQRKALGMPNGLLGTGLFANKPKKKKSNNGRASIAQNN